MQLLRGGPRVDFWCCCMQRGRLFLLAAGHIRFSHIIAQKHSAPAAALLPAAGPTKNQGGLKTTTTDRGGLFRRFIWR